VTDAAASSATAAAPAPAQLWVVRNVRGGPYDFSRGMREQPGWKEHAAFMNGLVDAGFIILGGPLQGGRDTLMICVAESEQAVRERFGQDPWAPSGMISVQSVERWTIVLSPPEVDEILAGAPRATADVYTAPAER
jgi:uncharacterized protein YciI